MSNTTKNAAFNAKYFPQQVLLLAVGSNVMPMGYWMVISKDPFRFLICLERSNHSLKLLREYGEAALHFMPWEERQKVVKAGYISGKDIDKSAEIGFERYPAKVLVHTELVKGAEVIYETRVYQEIEDLSGQFDMFVLDVVHAHEGMDPDKRSPILYLSLKDFAALGERWKYKK